MTKILGIMTHRVSRPQVFSRHAKSAIAEKFDGLLMYTPRDVNMKKRQISGNLYKNGSWSKATVPFPPINLDIGFYSPEDMHRATIVKKSSQLPFTGYGLGNKCKIQSHLVQSSYLKPYLLPTEQVKTAEAFVSFVKKHESVMLKPINGWGGKGIIRVTLHKDHFIVQRDGKDNQQLPRAELAKYVRGVLGSGRHLMQKWIDIRNTKGSVFDIRALLQKNGLGDWQTSGMAVREGKRGKITSNIKSGGDAYDVSQYLTNEFGAEMGEKLTETVTEIAEYIPSFLEKSYKSRLSELGIDLAVDRSGKPWLIEVNIKPGKMIMKRVYGQKAWEQSLHIGYQYARKLLEK
jgi:glutathione synthase/RimK-type ligase-like ATP-grasp enzyme